MDVMNKEEQKKEMATLLCGENVNGICNWDYEPCTGTCVFYQQDAENIYNAGYRKVPNGAVIIPAEERDEEMKEINKMLAERDELKEEIERLKSEINDYKQRYKNSEERYITLTRTAVESIEKKIKNAKIDVLNKVKSLSIYDINYLDSYVLIDDIDELIKAVQNDKDKS